MENVFGVPKLVIFLDFLETILVKINVTFVLFIDFHGGSEYLIYMIYLLPLVFEHIILNMQLYPYYTYLQTRNIVYKQLMYSLHMEIKTLSGNVYFFQVPHCLIFKYIKIGLQPKQFKKCLYNGSKDKDCWSFLCFSISFLTLKRA